MVAVAVLVEVLVLEVPTVAEDERVVCPATKARKTNPITKNETKTCSN